MKAHIAHIAATNNWPNEENSRVLYLCGKEDAHSSFSWLYDWEYVCTPGKTRGITPCKDCINHPTVTLLKLTAVL